MKEGGAARGAASICNARANNALEPRFLTQYLATALYRRTGADLTALAGVLPYPEV